MSPRASICECGERLLAAVGEETITTVEGDSMVFRRTTDYVLCPRCHKLYSIALLRDEEGAMEFAALNQSDFLDLSDLDAFRTRSVGDDQIPLEDEFG